MTPYQLLRSLRTQRLNHLRYALALILVLASVLVTNHVHADDHHSDHQSGDQIEQCLAFHQVHIDASVQAEHFELIENADAFDQVALFFSDIKTDYLLPPSQGPPSIS